MSSPLAFDRRPSCHYDLLFLCLRAAAPCICAGVSWVLRHLETWRNPSEEVYRGLCGALPIHLRLNMFLEFWAIRFASTQSGRIPRSPLRLILAALALSLSFVTAFRGSRLRP